MIAEEPLQKTDVPDTNQLAHFFSSPCVK
jgi:hypothetical protein